MRYLLPLSTLLIVFLSSSCKNVQRMIDKGNYEQAFEYSVNKLAGNSNQKTTHVQALEQAYLRLNTKDNNTITLLLEKDHIDRYDKVYDIYTTMERRQQTIQHIQPLVSKDGYVAHFQQISYADKLSTTAALAANEHYIEALRLLATAQDNKYAARSAYDRLQYIERYYSNYKDTDQLYEKAYTYGVDHVGVTMSAPVDAININPVPYQLTVVELSQLDNFWTHHHAANDTTHDFDYMANIAIHTIDPGIEKEYHNTYTIHTDMEDGQLAVKDTNGNTVTDSLGNTIYTTKYKRVTAQIHEIVREKYANLQGHLIITDTNNGATISTTPLEILHTFEDYASTYTGDKRALSIENTERLKPYCDEFPTDLYVVTDMTNKMKLSALTLLDRAFQY